MTKERRFVLSHECPHLRIEIWGTLGQICATRRGFWVGLVAASADGYVMDEELEGDYFEDG